MRHACERKPHLDARQRSGERQIIEEAEVPDTEYLAGELAQPRAKRHVETLKHDAPEAIRVVAIGQLDRGKRVAVFLRIAAQKLELPRAHCTSGGLAVPRVALEYRAEPFL